MGEPVVDGPLGRFPDVGRRVEVRLTDFEVNDRATGGFERPGAGSRLEGGLGADDIHPGGDSHAVHHRGLESVR